MPVSHNKGEKIVCVTFQNGNFARAFVLEIFLPLISFLMKIVLDSSTMHNEKISKKKTKKIKKRGRYVHSLPLSPFHFIHSPSLITSLLILSYFI
jgi:hypothetical protein